MLILAMDEPNALKQAFAIIAAEDNFDEAGNSSLKIRLLDGFEMARSWANFAVASRRVSEVSSCEKNYVSSCLCI
jgi:hypothetical protein